MFCHPSSNQLMTIVVWTVHFVPYISFWQQHVRSGLYAYKQTFPSIVAESHDRSGCSDMYILVFAFSWAMRGSSQRLCALRAWMLCICMYLVSTLLYAYSSSGSVVFWKLISYLICAAYWTGGHVYDFMEISMFGVMLYRQEEYQQSFTML